MAPSSNNPLAMAAPLPPLPDLPTAPGTGGAGVGAAASPGASGFLAQLLSGIGPIKSAVDQIQSGCQALMRLNPSPATQQAVAAILGLSASILPDAVQSSMHGPGAGGAGMSPMLPPPGGPQPIGPPGPNSAGPPPGPQGAQ
jgi:hypothetical protein